MSLTKYTESTMLPDEKVVYAASLHPFSRYLAITFIVLGAILLLTSLSSIISNVSDTEEPSMIGYYMSVVISKINSFTRSLPPEVREVIDKLMTLRANFLGILLMFVGFFMLLSSIIKKISVEHVITSKKIIYKKGLLEVREVEIPLHHIEGVKVKQTSLDMIINRGNVTVTGVGMEMMEIKKIQNPSLFRLNAYKAVDDYNAEHH